MLTDLSLPPLCQVAVDMDFNSEMLKLHQRVNPNEAVVGW